MNSATKAGLSTLGVVLLIVSGFFYWWLIPVYFILALLWIMFFYFKTMFDQFESWKQRDEMESKAKAELDKIIKNIEVKK